MDNIESLLNYKFKNINLLKKALTHSSYANAIKENIECNERLEFLGDAVLQLIVSEYLYNIHNDREGTLSKKRIEYVCETHLYEIAKNLHLYDYLQTSYGASNIKSKPSVLADALEAIIGAIFLDGGYENARNFIVNHIINNYVEIIDYKSKTIEYIQGLGYELPTYEIIDESGPEHDKIFVCKLSITHLNISYIGSGKTKKTAQQNASQKFYNEFIKK